MSLKLLALIDCQNDFIDGGLPVGYNNRLKAYQNIENIIQNDDFDYKIFTYDWHPILHCSYKDNGKNLSIIIVLKIPMGLIYIGNLKNI